MNDILPQPPSPPPASPPIVKNKKKKLKVSWLAVIFVIFLTIVLIILGERFMSDLNQWLNPAFDQYGGTSVRTVSSYYEADVLTRSYNSADYNLYRLVIHTALAIPLLLAALLLFFWWHQKRRDHPNRIIIWPYFILSLWIMFHVIIEAMAYIIEQYEKLGIYIVLIVLIVLLTWLTLFIQKKWRQKHESVN